MNCEVIPDWANHMLPGAGRKRPFVPLELDPPLNKRPRVAHPMMLLTVAQEKDPLHTHHFFKMYLQGKMC